ncbi:hypothetical protein HY626_04175 [Candidatus Uhrbacteria bacterium]|nr:hypothetical protein [Candidatus Uhrbacteria bacterium]
MNTLAIASALLAATCFLLALFILKNAQSPLHHLWAYFNICVGIWGAGICFASLTHSPEVAFRYWQLAHCGGVFVSVLFYHVIYTFCNSRGKIFLSFIYTQALIFFILNLFSRAGYHTELKFESIYYIKADNFVYVLFPILWFLPVIYGHLVLFKSFRRATGLKRNQMKYLFASMLIGFSGGAQHFFPVYDIDIYPYGNFLITIYTLVATYAIFRHRLLDIEIIVKRTIVFAGLFAMAMAVVGVFTSLTQTYLGRLLDITPTLSTALSVLIAILLYDPARITLVNLTDRFLFQKKYDYQKILKDAARGMAQITDLDKLLSLIVHFLTRRMRVESTSILLLNEDKTRYVLKATRGRVNPPLSMLASDALVKYIQESPRPVVTDELEQWMESARELKKRALSRDEVEAMVGPLKALKIAAVVPSTGAEGLIGFVMLGEKLSGEHYTVSDTNTLEALSHDAAIAISNARAFEDLKLAQQQIVQQEKLAAVGKLAADVSHEIRNPLTVVMGRAEMFLAQNPNLDEKTRGVLELIVKHTKRQLEIVERLLKFSRKKEPKFELMPVEKAIQEAIDMLENQAVLKDIKLVKIIPSNLPPIMGDANLLQEVFFNIINNAQQAIGDRGGEIKVEVELIAGGREIQATIIDDGPGITPENLKKIFDPFFTTKEIGKGTGLGLSLCSEFITRHRGSLNVESVVGRGTTFFIRLPVAAGVEIRAGGTGAVNS